MYYYSLVRIIIILFNNIKMHVLGILEWAENALDLYHSSLTLTNPRESTSDQRPIHFHLVIKLKHKNIYNNKTKTTLFF